MTRRTMIGLAVGLAATLAVGAGAVAVSAHGGRHGIMKRVAAAAIDEALDEARVTPAQRAEIHAIRDRVFATVEQHRGDRRTHLEEALQLFEADQVDRARVEALHAAAEADRREIREAVHQALVEVHGILMPEQRKAVADWVRAHRWARAH